MQLMLSDDEARTLGNLLHDYLPTLRREELRTDIAAHEIKDELKKRLALVERLVKELPGKK